MRDIRKRMIAALANLSLLVGMFYFPVEASGVDTIPGGQEELIDEIYEEPCNNLEVPGNPGWKAGALATAQWDAVEGADYYDIVVRVYQGETFIGEGETGTSETHADLQQEIRDLAPEDAYQVNVEFKVRARVLAAEVTGEYSAFSERKEYSVNAMAELDPPTEVSIVLEGDSVFVYFKPVENADHYKVSTYIAQNNVAIGGSVDTNDGTHEIVMKNGFCVVDISLDFAQSYESYLGEDVEIGGHVQAVTADGNESECSNEAEPVPYRKNSILPTPVIVSINVAEDGKTVCRFTDETVADDYDVDIVFKNFISGEGGTERNPEERTTRLGEQMSRLCGKPVKNANGEYVIDLLPVIRFWLHFLNAINPTAPTDVEIRIRSISGGVHSAFSNVIELKDYITEPYYIAPANVVLTETEDGYYELSFDKAGDAPVYSVDYYVYKGAGRAQMGREFTLDEISWDGDRGTVDLTKEFRELYEEVDGDDTYWFDAVVRGKSTGDVERGLRSEYSNKVQVYKNVLRRFILHPDIPVVAIGKSLYIGKEVVPFYGYYEKIAWSSEDESIATVDQTGKVTGVTEGHTVITAVVDETVRSSVSVNIYELQSNLEDVSGADSLISQAEDIIDDIANLDDPNISKTDIDPASLEQIRDEICDGAVSGNSFHTDMVSEEKNIGDYSDELDAMEKIIGAQIEPPMSEEKVSENNVDCVFVCGYDVSIQVYHKDKAGRQYRVGNIVETNDDVRFYLEIPKNMHWTTGGDFSFYLLREHNGVVEKIPVAVNADGSFSVVSDKFSDFVLVAMTAGAEAETEARSHAINVMDGAVARNQNGEEVSSAKENEKINISWIAKEDYVFAGWELEGAAAEDKAAAETSFVMGTEDVTVSFKEKLRVEDEVNEELPKDTDTTTKVKSLKFEKKKLTLQKNKGKKAFPAIVPDGTVPAVVYVTENKDIVAVDKAGNFYPMGVGEATVTAYCGNKKAKCKVSVVNYTASVILKDDTETEVNGGTIEMKAGEQRFITVSFKPYDSTDSRVVRWSSDDKKVTVKNGIVTAKEVTETVTATITATVKAGDPASGKTGTLKQTVKIKVTPVEVPKASKADKSHSISVKKSIKMTTAEGMELALSLKAKKGTDAAGLKIVSIESSNNDVVSVNNVSALAVNGSKSEAKIGLEAKAAGTAYVIVKSTSGDGSRVNVQRCKISVTSPASDLRVKNGTIKVSDKNTAEMRKGMKGTVEVLLTPKFSTDAGKVKISCSGGVSVKNGIIYAKKIKNGKITVKCGKLKQVIAVTVTK